MRITITGATGLIGGKLLAALQERGDEVTVLTRDPGKAPRGTEAHRWDPNAGPAPTEASPAISKNEPMNVNPGDHRSVPFHGLA